MRGSLVMVCLTLALALAGCTDPSDSDSDDSDATAASLAHPEPWTIDNTASGCLEAFLLVPLEADAVAPHLPEGFAPADLQTMLGTPFATGSSGAYITAYECAESAYGNVTLLGGDWGFVVAAPNVEGVNESVSSNLYTMQSFTANPLLAGAFEAAGVEGHWVAPSVLVDVLPTGSSIGAAEFADADGVVAEWNIAAPVPQPFTVAARFWHSAEHGTVYGEYLLDGVPTANGGATCTFRAGSMIADALGFTDCNGHGVVGLTLNGADWDSKYVFLPGVWAT